MKTRWFLTSLVVSTAPQGMVAKHTAFGIPKPLTSTSIFITRTIPRGGQQRYDYTDYEEAYRNPTSSRGDHDDRYGSTSPEYHEDYRQGRSGEEDRGYFDEDRGYYDDRGTSMRRREEEEQENGRGGVGGVMSKFRLPNIIKTGNRKIGLPLLGIGAALTVLGISLFFNKTLMRLGNLFFVAGVPMTIGPGRTAGYFFQPTKARATGCLALGIFLVFVGWPVLGIALEVFGFLNLFGNMFPVAMVVLKTMPVIGPLLRGEVGGGGGGRKQQRYDGEDFDDDYYYGGGGEGGGRRGVTGDRGDDDRGYYYDDRGGDPDEYNQRYY